MARTDAARATDNLERGHLARPAAAHAKGNLSPTEALPGTRGCEAVARDGSSILMSRRGGGTTRAKGVQPSAPTAHPS